jgi:hypothetical protein
MLQLVEARVVTLVVSNAPPKEIQIAEGEVAELTGWTAYTATPNALGMPYQMTAVKDGIEVSLYVPPSMITFNGGINAFPAAPAKHTIAGPAMIRLVPTGTTLAYCTFSITPETFPPDKTLILPPGTNQVAVTLECSTNLVSWAAATNGVYGSATGAKFFRIKAQVIN